MPGISAVSPPTSAAPACTQPSTMPRTTASATADLQLAGRVVIEEEQRLRALHHHVVDAHRDQVDADGVVAAGVDREAQLGADAVGAGHQHRMPVAGRQLHQRAEAADAGEHLAALRALHQRLDALDELVAGVDVDAGIAIGDAGAFTHDYSRRAAWVRAAVRLRARMLLYMPPRAGARAIQTMSRTGPKITRATARARTAGAVCVAVLRAAAAVSARPAGARLRGRRRRPVGAARCRRRCARRWCAPPGGAKPPKIRRFGGTGRRRAQVREELRHRTARRAAGGVRCRGRRAAPSRAAGRSLWERDRPFTLVVLDPPRAAAPPRMRRAPSSSTSRRSAACRSA